MADNNGKLTGRQKRAIAAILSSRNKDAAALTSGIPASTIYRWMSDPVFKAALTAAEAELLSTAGRRLLAGIDEALDELWGLTQNGEPADRRHALKNWLDYAIKIREVDDHEARLAALEAGHDVRR